MITYQIQVSEHSGEAFHRFLESLKQLGVVVAYRTSDNVVVPGDAMEESELLTLLEKAENQIFSGDFVSTAAAKAFIEEWKKKKL